MFEIEFFRPSLEFPTRPNDQCTDEKHATRLKTHHPSIGV